MITGQYDTDGYTIFQDGKEIYRAGNNPYDSYQSAHLGDVLPIGILAMYCQDVIVESAEDRNDTVGECIRVY